VEAHGDHAGAELLARYRTLVRGAVAAAHGAEIKTEGDSFYVVFDSASAAVRCGQEILAAADAAPGEPIRVGVGVHAGETVETEEGFVGSAVNIAARLCAQARPGELVVSDTVRALTRTYLDVEFEPLGSRRLKGVNEQIALYRIAGRASPGAQPQRPPRAAGLGRPGRSVVLAGVGLVAVVVLVAGAFAVGSGALRAGPAATPIPATSAAVAGTSNPTPSASNSFPNAAEKALLADLAGVPDIPVDTCQRDPESPFSFVGLMVAGVQCFPDISTGASEVIVRRFDPGTLERHGLSTWIRVEPGHQGAPDALPEGDCATTERAIGTWSVAGDERGVLACGIEEETGDALVAWADDFNGLLISARNPRGDSAALYGFFARNARFIAP
jgi:hypothetical protein